MSIRSPSQISSSSNNNNVGTRKAYLELNERDELTAGYLSILRGLIDEETNLYCPMNDAFLLRFLRARKFNPERAFKLLKQYYEMRRNHAEVFHQLYPEALVKSFEHGLQAVLPERDQNGRQIFLFDAGAWDPSVYSLDDIFRTNYLFLEEMTNSTETQVNGMVAIVNFKNLNFYHARHFTPKHAQRMINIIQDSFPCRFKEFHLVNQPFVFSMLFSVVKPFLNQKIRDRIHFHGSDLNSLHGFLSPSLLPPSLGGECELDDSFVQQMLEKNDYYKDLLKFGYRESSPFV